MRPRSPLTTTCGRSPSPTGRGERRGRSGSTRKTPQWKCEIAFYTKYLVIWVFQKNWTRFFCQPHCRRLLLDQSEHRPGTPLTFLTKNKFNMCEIITIPARLLPRQLPPFWLVLPGLPAWGGRGTRGGANGIGQDGNNQRRVQVRQTKSKNYSKDM